jgi:CheY-like chemotaxis protein
MHIHRMLIIDDDPDDRDLIVQAVSEIDTAINCSFAHNGKEAISQLVTGKAMPDLIILDLNMPVMDGFAFLKFRQSVPEIAAIPVVVHTTADDHSLAREIRSLGANEFTTKPDSFDALIQKLRTILSTFITNRTPH